MKHFHCGRKAFFFGLPGPDGHEFRVGFVEIKKLHHVGPKAAIFYKDPNWSVRRQILRDQSHALVPNHFMQCIPSTVPAHPSGVALDRQRACLIIVLRDTTASDVQAWPVAISCHALTTPAAPACRTQDNGTMSDGPNHLHVWRMTKFP